jgi:Protein of unknown function (DUF3631)
MTATFDWDGADGLTAPGGVTTKPPPGFRAAGLGAFMAREKARELADGGGRASVAVHDGSQSVVSRGEGLAGARSGAVAEMGALAAGNMESFACELRDILGRCEGFLRYAGTLHGGKGGGREYLGWGSDEAVWMSVLWAAAASCRKRCTDKGHDAIEGAHPDGGESGGLAWRALMRLWFYALPSVGEGAVVSKKGEGSGKSALGELVTALCVHPSQQLEPTGPGLARLLGVFHQTIFVDESGLLFGKTSARKTMVMTLLLGGFSQGLLGGAQTSHAWGRGVNGIGVVGPVVLAANGSMSDNDSEAMAMLETRMLGMEIVKCPWEGMRPPRLTSGQVEAVGEYRGRLTDLMSLIAGEAGGIQVPMPEWMDSRQADGMEPLAVVAMLAGGEWPERFARGSEWFLHGGRERAVKIAAWEKAKVSAGDPAGWTEPGESGGVVEGVDWDGMQVPALPGGGGASS